MRRPPPPTPRPLRAALALVWLLATILVAALPGTAAAAGSPNLSLTVDGQDVVLYGKEATVRMVASTPSGAATAHNLSYRAVLPAGVSYVAGSAGALAGEPTRIAGQPGSGQTTLLWVNVADVAGGTAHTLDFKVLPSTLTFGVQGSFTVRGDAYAQADRRAVPPFTATGVADAGAATPASALAENVTDTSRFAALTVTKDTEDTPDDELLRGVHDHQTIFTLTVRTNAAMPMTSVNLFDYLPAGLEFLGCGGPVADHTTAAPTNPGSAQEYPGSGPIVVPATSGCTVPSTVQTSTFDPDGAATAFGSGVYTQARWTLGTLAPNSVVTIRYRAAIPLRRNTATWPGAIPAITGLQATNLNNNSGTEVAGGEALTSFSNAVGFYNGNGALSMGGDTTLRRFAEDLAIAKKARSGGLASGTTVLWDLVLRTSEYRSAADVVVTDTVPDGLCPIRGGGPLTEGAPSAADTAECSSGGPSPSVPYASANERTDGSWLVVWNQSTDPALAQLGPSQTHTITFPTATRANYQEAFEDATPILGGDVVRNAVGVAGSARVICAGRVACPAGAPTGQEVAHDGSLSTGAADSSTDRLTAESPTLDQKVATTSGTCSAAAYTDATGPAAPAYRPGDRICWLLRVAYPASLASQGDTIVDYLPPTLAFDGGFGSMGEEPTGADTVGAGPVDATAATPGPGGELRWTVPGTYAAGGAVFERRIATRAVLRPGGAVGDVATNLLKSSALTTGAANVALRDTADYRLSMPVMATQKRVVALNGTDLPSPVATQVVRGGDVVRIQVQLTNTSDDSPAERVEAWDRLPTGVTCADVTASGGSISGGGICDASDQTVKWGASPSIGPDVPAPGSVALTYSVRVPTTTRPTQVLTSAAGIRQYQTTTNTGGAFTYVPASNIDPAQSGLANVPAAGSAATLTGAEPTITETRTTSLTEPTGVENNGPGDATIGETIHYVVRTVVPAGLTVDRFQVTDAVDARHTFVPGSLALTTGAAPAGGSFGTTAPGSTDILLDLGPSWTAPTGADSVFVFEFDAIVADVAANFRNGLGITNQAALAYDNPAGTPARNTTLGALVTTNIVEPVLTVDKTVDVAGNPVIGGQVVEFTVKVGAASGNASPAHETVAWDTVPVGLTPVDGAGTPVADGATLPDGDPALTDGTWDQAARRVVFAPAATIDPGATNTFRYRAQVDIPPTSGTSLSGTATAQTTSLPGSPAAPVVERRMTSARTVGYEASKALELKIRTPSVATTASPTTATPGEQVLFTSVVTIPANTIAYDVFAREVLPPELEFDAFVDEVCTAGCGSGATTPTVRRYAEPAPAAAPHAVAWDLGDLTVSSPQTRTIALTYKAHVRLTRRTTSTTIIRPAIASNAITVASNRTDRITTFDPAAPPTPTGFDDLSAPSTAIVTTVEPVMAIDKQLAVNAGGYGSTPVVVRDGDAMHYRVTVRNTGDAPAHDVEVRDVPPAKFRNVRMAAGAATVTNNAPWTAPGDTIGWLIPGPIPPNGSVVLEYDADLPAVTDMRDNDAFTNTATIQHAWGVSSANRTARPAPKWGYRDYSVATLPALTRSTTAVYDAPTISVNKTTGISPSFPKSGPAEVGKLFTWRVTVTNTSGTAGGRNLTIRDTLPRDWRYEPGTSAFTAGTTVEPGITSKATGDELVWTTTTPLAAGASVLLTYQARPTKASATSIGTGTAPSARHVNAATASVLNGAGAPADLGGPFAPAAPDTAYAVLAVPVITVVQTPDAAAPPAAPGAGAQGIAGTPVEYLVKVRNTGAVAATNVVITDALPSDGIPNTYAPGSASALPASGFTELSASDAEVRWRIPSLAAGATVDIRVPVRTDPAAAEASQLVNTASVVTDQTVDVADTGTFRLVGSADLRAAKTAVAAVNAGQTLDYVISATNLGPSVARDVVLRDPLPETVLLRSTPPGCTRSGAGTTANPTVVTCTFPGVTGVGETVSRTISTRVRTGVASRADNTVTASSATADPVGANNAATARVDVGEVADLKLVKTIAGRTGAAAKAGRVVRGDEVRFDLTFVNEGPSDALTATVTDTLPAGLTYVSDTGGCTYAAGTRKLTCPVAGGLLAHEPSSPPDPADPGQPKSITVVTTATGLGAQSNSASVVGGAPNAEPTPADNTDTAVVTVDPSVALGLAMTAPATVGAGETLTYALTATNAGKDTSTGTTLRATLPAGTTFVSADPGCTAAAGEVTCGIGALAGRGAAGTGPVGSTSRSIIVRAPFALAEQAITAGAALSSVETDLDPADAVTRAAASATTQVGPAADLSITQEAPGEVAAGGALTYTLLVRNDGPSTAPDVVLTDALPEGTSLRESTSPVARSAATGARAGASSCSEAAGTVTCALGAMTSGTSAAVTLTVDVPAGLAGRLLTNAASVRSSIVDPTPANASSSLARRVADLPAPPPPPAPAPEPTPTPTPAPTPAPPPEPGTANLVLAKKAEGVARAGRELAYTITATNQGPAAATDTVMTDALVGGVEFKNARAASGTCGYENGSVRCRIGTIAVGESVNMRVIVVPSKTGMLVNDAVVVSKVDDPHLADNRAVATNAVSPHPPTKLSLKATISSTKLRGGQRLTYTAKVRNTGPNEAIGLELCDRVPQGMAFTSTKGGAVKSSRLCLTQARLAPGKTATFKVRVRLSARARKGTLVNKVWVDAENAVQKNGSVAAKVVTDGKVGSEAVRGFTG